MPFLCSRCGFQIPQIPDRPAPRCPRCWTSLSGGAGFPMPEPPTGADALSPLEAALPALPRDPGPGDRVAACRLLKEWSRREGAATFEALEEESGEDVLLSILLDGSPPEPALEGALDLEATRARALAGGHLRPLLGWGVEEGFPFLIHGGRGRSLAAWIDGRRRASRKGKGLRGLETWLVHLADLSDEIHRAHEGGVTLGGLDASHCAVGRDGMGIDSIGLGRGAWRGLDAKGSADVEGLIAVATTIAGLADEGGRAAPALTDLPPEAHEDAGVLASHLRRLATA